MGFPRLKQDTTSVASLYEMPAQVMSVERTAASVSVLAVGQTPPPINGQTLMIQAFLNGKYDKLRIAYVPMRFSRSSAELVRFDFRKLFILFSTLFEIVVTRFRTGTTVLYYPPADPNLVPVLRDMVLLIPTRWLFSKTIFHFHAAGLCDIYRRLPKLLRPLFHLAYNNPDLAIFTTAATSADALQMHAKKTAIVPCGIEDRSPSDAPAVIRKTVPPMILFVGILCEGKGLFNLLEACHRLLLDGLAFRLVCLGQFQSEEFKIKVENFLAETSLRERVQFPGVVTGIEKDVFFAEASLFCLPSHYNAESFGVVLIEAMSFSLPIVATDWRGIPEVLGRGSDDTSSHLEGARLVPIRDPDALADALSQVLRSPINREAMGKHNRTRFLDLFTVEKYRQNLEFHLACVARNIE